MVLNFTLSEEGVAVFHDALACMFKFSDDVCLEARKEKLTLTTLNISKSAYICFTFAANRFFSRYNFEGNAQYRDRFFCQLYIKSLLSVFRTRQGDPSRDKDASIERCDVAIDDGPGKKSRLVARIACRNGITASHSLAFEPKAPTHAKFDKTQAGNHWSISSRTLRQLMDHFGPGIELLDINTDEENRVVNFTCFTEKSQKRNANSNEAVLKKPLHTNIAVEMDEFDDVQVQGKLHIIISVKDFRAILQHAQLTSGDLNTTYSDPGRPMKLSYSGDGIICEFILMTVGEKDANTQKHKNPRANTAAAAAANSGRNPQTGLDSGSHRGSSVLANNDNQQSQRQQQQQKTPTRGPLAPRQPQFEIRPPPMPPPATARSDSLFVGQDDDQLWEPVNPDEDDEEDDADNARLEWNTTANEPVILHIPTSNSSTTCKLTKGAPQNPSLRISSYLPRPNAAEQTQNESQPTHLSAGLEPTQRLSEVRRFGLFSP
ncbi:Rad9-domain-containing protein [Apodospora peruviana]|uniref:DNA repair protein rad9 n=1 Tax=Apodospora peruviana TaxID=516989 RepID=A0AAE0ICK2_9PEZI|nr:Rad9-domain-containing protein [Apodospora peruviana]